jgi:hypothetical protein
LDWKPSWQRQRRVLRSQNTPLAGGGAGEEGSRGMGRSVGAGPRGAAGSLLPRRARSAGERCAGRAGSTPPCAAAASGCVGPAARAPAVADVTATAAAAAYRYWRLSRSLSASLSWPQSIPRLRQPGECPRARRCGRVGAAARVRARRLRGAPAGSCVGREAEARARGWGAAAVAPCCCCGGGGAPPPPLARARRARRGGGSRALACVAPAGAAAAPRRLPRAPSDCEARFTPAGGGAHLRWGLGGCGAPSREADPPEPAPLGEARAAAGRSVFGPQHLSKR